MNDKIILISLIKDELKNLMKDSLIEVLNQKNQNELLTFKVTCQLLSISSSCLNQWKSQEKIPYKKLGKRIYFNRNEIISELKEAGSYKKLKELE